MIQQIDDLQLIKPIGSGSFGEVYLSKKLNSNKLFATKKVNIRPDNLKSKKYLDYEINIMKSLQHPNIVKLEEIKKYQNTYYIVMEYINGGSLSDHLKKYKSIHQKGYTEEIVQYLMRQIVSGLTCIHNNNIIHRDLKLENIMVHYENEKDKEQSNLMKAQIKIIDFGFAIILPSTNSLTNSAVGTFYYMDPKILDEFYQKALVDKKKGYGKEADIWSLGIICYELLRAKKPFDADSFEELRETIKKGQYRLPKTVSKEYFDFLGKMLVYDGKARSSVQELFLHPFLTKKVSDFQKIDSIQQIPVKNPPIPIKDSIEIAKERQLRSKEKELKKFNSFGNKPIKEDDSIGNTQDCSNLGFNMNYASAGNLSFYGQPMSLNPQPQMQIGMLHGPFNNLNMNMVQQPFPQYNQYLPGNYPGIYNQNQNYNKNIIINNNSYPKRI